MTAAIYYALSVQIVLYLVHSGGSYCQSLGVLRSPMTTIFQPSSWLRARSWGVGDWMVVTTIHLRCFSPTRKAGSSICAASKFCKQPQTSSQKPVSGSIGYFSAEWSVLLSAWPAWSYWSSPGVNQFSTNVPCIVIELNKKYSTSQIFAIKLKLRTIYKIISMTTKHKTNLLIG